MSARVILIDISPGYDQSLTTQTHSHYDERACAGWLAVLRSHLKQPRHPGSDELLDIAARTRAVHDIIVVPDD